MMLTEILPILPGEVRKKGPDWFETACPWCHDSYALQLTLRGFNCSSELCGETGSFETLAKKIRDARPGGDESPALASLRSLAAIIDNPEALQPPNPVVPRMAWAGRTTLLFAREKAGKSTVVTAAAAAVSSGTRIFGGDPPVGDVLVLGLEEHVSDQARRLMAFGADPARVWLLDRVAAPLADLAAAVEETQPALVVIDTLAAFVRPLALDSGATSAWEAAVGRIGQIARSAEAAILVLHHANKANGEYRDSTAIGAAVDMLLKMERADLRETRRITPTGRWALDPYVIRLHEGAEDRPAYYSLDGGEISIDGQVFAFVVHHPGCSQRAVRDSVRGSADEVRKAIHRLLKGGEIEDRGDARGMKLFQGGGNPYGTGAEPLQNQLGTSSQNHGGQVVLMEDPPLHSKGVSPEPPLRTASAEASS